jgi:pyruvate kinase
MVAAGMNMARLWLAHGPVEETLERIQRVRRAADEEGEIVGILADLPGPKVRAAGFPEGGVYGGGLWGGRRLLWRRRRRLGRRRARRGGP